MLTNLRGAVLNDKICIVLLFLYAQKFNIFRTRKQLVYTVIGTVRRHAENTEVSVFSAFFCA